MKNMKKPVLTQEEIDAILETYGDDPSVGHLLKQMEMSRSLSEDSNKYSKNIFGAAASGLRGYEYGLDKAAAMKANTDMMGRVKRGRRAGMGAIMTGMNDDDLGAMPAPPLYPVLGTYD